MGCLREGAGSRLPSGTGEPEAAQPQVEELCGAGGDDTGRVPLLRASLCSQAVKRFLKLECKCHGVSGSCTLRTCWLAMSDFRKTGDYLRKKYNGAIQVIMNQDGTGFTVANKNFRKPTKTDLVYFENSPDYCVMDKSAGKKKHPGSPKSSSSSPPGSPATPKRSSLERPLWDDSFQAKQGGQQGLSTPRALGSAGSHCAMSLQVYTPAQSRMGFVQNPQALHQRPEPCRPLVVNVARSLASAEQRSLKCKACWWASLGHL